MENLPLPGFEESQDDQLHDRRRAAVHALRERAAGVSLGVELVNMIISDPEALELLRKHLPPPEQPKDSRGGPYTTQTLAAKLGRTQRSVLAAIGRGDLRAKKQGRGYVINDDAVDDWARADPAPSAASTRPPRRRTSRRGDGPGPMARGVGRR